MAALVEGCQYGLFSNFNSSSNRSVVHVKLTDTSLKLIEDYLKRKPQEGQKPCILFQGHQGTISIPDTGDKARAFQFSLAAIQADPRGSFDCIQQSDTKSSSELRLEGSMAYKINIHGTNEVFQMTKDRVTQAELDHQKVATKMIKKSGPHISRKRTTVIKQPPPSQQPAARHQTALPVSQQPASRHQTALPVKPKSTAAPPVNFSKRPSPSYGSQGHAVSPHNPTSVSSTSAKPLSPSLNSSITSAASRPTSNRNSAVMSMPYRDRIIHLLAVRPYKKPELIFRLRKDGVGEKDKDSLGSILNQVAVLRDNNFILTRSAYTDVRLDWPFYSDEDRNIVKKKLPSLSSTSPVPSPASRSPDSPSSTSVQHKRPDIQKRPVPIEDTSSSHHKRHSEDSSSQHTAKKKRISLYEKGPPKADLNTSSDRRVVTSTTDKSDKKENIANESSDNIASSTSDVPEYYGKYCSIQSTDQRRRYKEEFNTEYDEYRDLHKNIEKVSKKFHELEVMLKKTPKDSDDFETLQDRIRSEYKLQKGDPKYTEQKKRFEYLHGKLAYIKKLILDYDNLQTAMCS